MASAPLWQYIVIMVIFSLGFILNLVSVGLMLFLEKVKPDALSWPQKDLGVGSLLFKTLMAIFAAYLTYSLYVWAPNALSLSILIVHWATLFVHYVVSIAKAGKIRTYTYGQHFFGILYTAGMVTALITYGVKWL